MSSSRAQQSGRLTWLFPDFCPPMAVNLMANCRMTHATMASAIRWVVWLLLFTGLGRVAMVFIPALVPWHPQVLGFM
jgi:TRAP-type C4-dicarboxylate transport system permease large subunit